MRKMEHKSFIYNMIMIKMDMNMEIVGGHSLKENQTS